MDSCHSARPDLKGLEASRAVRSAKVCHVAVKHPGLRQHQLPMEDIKSLASARSRNYMQAMAMQPWQTCNAEHQNSNALTTQPTSGTQPPRKCKAAVLQCFQ